jgi:predicted phage-related endonuclease
MITKIFETEEDWLKFREGKITGSKLGDITLKRGGGYKKGYYDLIAQKVAIEDEEEVPSDPKERGHYLEPICLERFAKETGKKVDGSLIMWVREDNKNIAYSPDGVISDEEAVECKCLASASHIEAWLTKKVPSEYEEQVLQAFIVNDKLQKLYFCFYDPRIPSKDFFYFTVTREEVKDKVAEMLDFEMITLEEINRIVVELTF